MRDARSIVSHCRQAGTLLKQFTAYASGRSGRGSAFSPATSMSPHTARNWPLPAAGCAQ